MYMQLHDYVEGVPEIAFTRSARKPLKMMCNLCIVIIIYYLNECYDPRGGSRRV